MTIPRDLLWGILVSNPLKPPFGKVRQQTAVTLDATSLDFL